jgi:hypothetical protein
MICHGKLLKIFIATFLFYQLRAFLVIVAVVSAMVDLLRDTIKL